MKLRSLNTVIASVIGLLAAPTALYAASLDAHVHGVAELAIAIEGKSLEVQFASPAMNLVGFEHKATTAEQIATVKKVETQLNESDALFVITGNGCKPAKAVIDVSSLKGDGDSHSDEKHDHGHAHSHAHTGDQHYEEAPDDSHSEITAHYQFECKNETAVSSIAVQLFQRFPQIEKINAMWVTPTTQGAETLTAKQPVIEFR
ncbi:MAG: DUF2796 domain-containing protein [Pseudomonadales bacterium]|nr:DUF2796 domain-containing protein [Pseudomonadales bacterium]